MEEGRKKAQILYILRGNFMREIHHRQKYTVKTYVTGEDFVTVLRVDFDGDFVDASRLEHPFPTGQNLQ